ncbi:MAG: aminotransferase class I/II-fold pyridoxal phosphate-dependent enzyme, partial [Angelakisella sp.]
KSPYNVSSLTQIAFLSAYKNADFIEANALALTESRERLAGRLSKISAIRVYPSKANFLLIETAFADLIYEKLLENGVIVRRFNGNRLRISSGTAEQADLIADIIGKAVSDI